MVIEKTLDVQQIARRLNVSTRTVYRLKADLPLIPTGPKKAYRAKEADVESWQERRTGIELW